MTAETFKESALRGIFSGCSFEGEVRFNEPMSLHTSLGIGGPADALAFPKDVFSLRRLLGAALSLGVRCTAMGRGTNMLVKDGGVRGILVSLDKFRGVEALGIKGDAVTLRAEAGHLLKKLVDYSARKGLSGLEAMAGIPGTVGGAVSGNSGAYGREMKDVIASVSLVGPDGELKTVKKEDLGFSYRRAQIPQGAVIRWAEVVLRKDDPSEVSKRIKEFLGEKKITQPLGERSAGCVFKNPEGASAGKLVEEAGLKGMRTGGIEVSGLHANFFINKGGGTASDFLKLMDAVSERIREIFGILLEPEIRILGS